MVARAKMLTEDLLEVVRAEHAKVKVALAQQQAELHQAQLQYAYSAYAVCIASTHANPSFFLPNASFRGRRHFASHLSSAGVICNCNCNCLDSISELRFGFNFGSAFRVDLRLWHVSTSYLFTHMQLDSYRDPTITLIGLYHPVSDC